MLRNIVLSFAASTALHFSSISYENDSAAAAAAAADDSSTHLRNALWKRGTGKEDDDLLGALPLSSIVSIADDDNDKEEYDGIKSHNGNDGNASSSQERPSFGHYYTDAAKDDMIASLPGLDYDPGFRQFSGYLTVSEENGREIFYWYVESQNDPSNDPVVFWTNGGPGCSGLFGFGTEHGPFEFKLDGTLERNPYSWNTAASILYVEQPAGVGFSFSRTDADYENVGDARAAADNYELLVRFLERYPERKSNDLYIASESYGGHYIPQLAAEILRRNVDGAVNFRGFLVGNPYVDPFSNTVTQFEAYYSHGLLPLPVFSKWRATCSVPDAYNNNAEECDRLEYDLMSLIGRGINPYALDFPVCKENGDVVITDRGADWKNYGGFLSAQGKKLLLAASKYGGDDDADANDAANNPPFLPRSDKYHPCAGVHLSAYLSREDVQRAIHVLDVGKEWRACSDALHYNMSDVAIPQIELYRNLLKEATSKGGPRLNMLVFSGDDDSICSTAGTQYWIYDVGVRASDLWKPWKVDGQTAGYVTKFDLKDENENEDGDVNDSMAVSSSSSSSFSFATVHGAGHEVPAYRPKEALVLFKTFLSGEW